MTVKYSLYALLVVLVLACTTGCGKKGWPEPIDSQDRFVISSAKATKIGGCLTVDLAFDMNAGNVEEVFLDYALEECPGCPVNVTERRAFDPKDPSTLLKDGTMTISVCGLDSDGAYRWRVEATNFHPAAGSASTDFQSTTPF